MKVAIIFIGTNKYLNFLPKYYKNIEEYFLPNIEKVVLAFTDGELNETPNNLKVYHQEHLDWPYITLKRFEIINKARQTIEECSHLVFIDADALPVTTITEDEFFTDKPLFGVHHPCHALAMEPHNKYPGAFETDVKSRAHVTENDDTTMYWQGCLWGGKIPEVCAMIDELMERTNLDLKDGIVAKWHDESHINKYFIENKDKVHTLGPQYAFPEVFADHCHFSPKIVHLAKDNSKYQT